MRQGRRELGLYPSLEAAAIQYASEEGRLAKK